MASTYTANQGIEKPATGDQSGTWGGTVNTNMDIIDRAVCGVGALTLTGSTTTLTTTDGSLTDGMYRVLVLGDGGDLGSNNTITIAPNDQDKLYLVYNNLSASRDAIFSQGTGTNATVTNGASGWIYADGAGSGAAVTLAILKSALVPTTLTDGGVLLGSGTGEVTAMSVLADSEMIVGDGSTDPVAESGATLRNSVGVGTGDSPQFTNLTTTGHTQRSLATGITAGTTQTMAGATALTKDINIVTVNGNDDDGVALPTAVAGKEVTIINSDAAQRLQVWPGNGFSDTIDGGSANAVDANKLAAGGVRTYTADGSTNWVTATNPAISTPVGVASGGTGATSLTDGGVLLGSGTDAVTAMGVLADSTMIVGDGSTDPVAESGATLRDSIGVGTGDTPTFAGINLGDTDLDDYKVGTWTPAITAASGSGTIVYGTQDGSYTRIGNLMFLRFELQTTDIASRTGVIEFITGLPVLSKIAPVLMSGGGAASYWSGFSLPASGETVFLWVEDGTTNIKATINDSDSTHTEMDMSEWSDNGRIWGSIFYEIEPGY